MATLIFRFVFYSNASPQVVLTSTELTGAAAPTVNISSTAYSDGAIASVVSGGAMTYDSYTKSWSYRLAGADLASYVYLAAATTTYATASPAMQHAIGAVMPDELVGSRLATSGYTAPLDAAGMRGAVGLAAANVDTQFAAIAAKTANLPAVPAAAGDAMTLVAETLTEIATAVDTELSGTHGAGVWGSSSGAQSKVYTVYSGGLPLAGVYCRMTTDAAGLNNVDAGYTNAAGQVTFRHDLPAGTKVYIWRYKAGFVSGAADEETI